MPVEPYADIDLMPPAFAEGLDDWSRGDGTPDSCTYDHDPAARIARGDTEFGACLELRKTGPVQRLRYMGEMPMRAGSYVAITARLKVLRGPLPLVQIAAWPGGAGGRGVPDLPGTGALVRIPAHGQVVDLGMVIGPAPHPGVDLVWDTRVLYAHVGLDILGPVGAIIRIADISAHDVTRAFSPMGRVPPGFSPVVVTEH